MKLLRILAVGVLLCISVSSLADFRTIVRANEVILSELQLPASVNGITSFKACGACGVQNVNVNAATRYELNGESVSLQDFRRALAIVTDRQRKTAIVMHHLESDLVTQISVRL